MSAPVQGPEVYPPLTDERIEEIARILDEPQLKRLHGAILSLSLGYVAAVQEAPRAIRQLRAAVGPALPAPEPPRRITPTLDKIAAVMRDKALPADVALSEIQDFLTIAGYDVPLRTYDTRAAAQISKLVGDINNGLAPRIRELLAEIDMLRVAEPQHFSQYGKHHDYSKGTYCWCGEWNNYA